MMEWNLIFEMIEPTLLIVVAACWVLGIVVKQTPRIPDWTIVYIITIFAVMLSIGLIGLSVETVIQGVLCGAFAVYGHQVIKQPTKRE